MATATVVTTSGKVTAANRLGPATRAEPKFIGMGTGGGARTAAVTDTALTTEVETRATGTSTIVTVTNANDAYQTQGTITATAGRTVNEAGTFDASTVGNIDISATFPDIGLLSGDSLQFTFKHQMT